MNFLRKLKNGLMFIALNVIINHIPCWTIRKAFYKLLGMKIGKDARIGIYTFVADPRRIQIGRGTVINECCHLDGRGGIIIGNNVSISIYSTIMTASHDASSPKFEYVTGAVEIRDNAWIGTRAIILNNSTIAKRTIIGAGCVFKGKSEENAIYIGNPAKLIKYRELDNDYELCYKVFFK